MPNRRSIGGGDGGGGEVGGGRGGEAGGDTSDVTTGKSMLHITYQGIRMLSG